MSTDTKKMTGTSEEEDEDDMEMDVKDGEEKIIGDHVLVGIDEGMSLGCSEDKFQHYQLTQEQVSTPGGSRRCRPQEEKERTKLRERHRRAITARILAGLRRHGNYNLRVRADINDVIAALAREAGWVVLPDGTTFPSRTQGSRLASGTSVHPNDPAANWVPQQTQPATFGGISSDAGENVERHPIVGGSINAIGENKTVSMSAKLPERDFAGTPYVPVYVMLPLGAVSVKGEVIDPDGLQRQLRVLKSAKVDGVMVDCWWGIVESNCPHDYNWTGYKRLFKMVHDLKLKLQVMLSFHECGGNVGDDVCIPLPQWVVEVGLCNPDIYFTDRDCRRNQECLSWGIDNERVLSGRTALEVYFDYMRSFRVEFNDYFEDGTISMIEVGLGPCGELRYPSCPVKHGWRYPGIGAFQSYDQYLLKSISKAAEARGKATWARVPDNCGSYNSLPHKTGFFCDGGDYDSHYGRFFLNWYSQILVDHGDRVLSLAKLVFDGTNISAKMSATHWWYRTSSHAAELTAGFYNSSNRDGYAAVASMLKRHGAVLNFLCLESLMVDQQAELDEALPDMKALVWQVLNAAWDAAVPIASENALPCHDRNTYNKILEYAKPLNDADGRHILSFTYLRLSPILMERNNIFEFQRFVKCMHGEALAGP